MCVGGGRPVCVRVGGLNGVCVWWGGGAGVCVCELMCVCVWGGGWQVCVGGVTGVCVWWGGEGLAGPVTSLYSLSSWPPITLDPTTTDSLPCMCPLVILQPVKCREDVTKGQGPLVILQPVKCREDVTKGQGPLVILQPVKCWEDVTNNHIQGSEGLVGGGLA